MPSGYSTINSGLIAHPQKIQLNKDIETSAKKSKKKQYIQYCNKKVEILVYLMTKKKRISKSNIVCNHFFATLSMSLHSLLHSELILSLFYV